MCASLSVILRSPGKGEYVLAKIGQHRCPGTWRGDMGGRCSGVGVGWAEGVPMAGSRSQEAGLRSYARSSFCFWVGGAGVTIKCKLGLC